MSTNLLTDTEQTELAQAEQVISRNLNAFQQVGSALLKIRDGKLYRASFQNFESYLRTKWGMSRARAYQLCDLATTVNELSTVVDILPEAERHVRPLTALDTPEQKAEAWTDAVTTASAEQRPVTGADVQNSVDKIKNLQAGPKIQPQETQGEVHQPTALDAQWAQAAGVPHYLSEVSNRFMDQCREFLSLHPLPPAYRIELAGLIAENAITEGIADNELSLKREFELQAAKLRHASKQHLAA